MRSYIVYQPIMLDFNKNVHIILAVEPDDKA